MVDQAPASPQWFRQLQVQSVAHRLHVLICMNRSRKLQLYSGSRCSGTYSKLSQPNRTAEIPRWRITDVPVPQSAGTNAPPSVATPSQEFENEYVDSVLSRVLCACIVLGRKCMCHTPRSTQGGCCCRYGHQRNP